MQNERHIITMNKPMSEKDEASEEQLRQIIHQAGEEARERKKKAMAHHYKKLKAVVAEGVARRQNNKISETAQ